MDLNYYTYNGIKLYINAIENNCFSSDQLPRTLVRGAANSYPSCQALA
jgi:hypothetical protein